MSDEEPREEIDLDRDAALSLADKLNKLFRLKRMADGSRPSNEAAEEYIRASGGPTISATYLWQLRKGLKDNPTKRHLEALAAFFGVPVTYFFGGEDERRIDEKLNLLEDISNAGVYNLARSASGLSPQRLQILESMVEQLVQLEAQSRQIAEGGPNEGPESSEGD